MIVLEGRSDSPFFYASNIKIKFICVLASYHMIKYNKLTDSNHRPHFNIGAFLCHKIVIE